MIPVHEAQKIISQQLPTKKVISVPLRESLHYVLAENVFSDIDLPPFDKSAMDGYALRADDIKGAPVELEVIEVVPAGQAPSLAVKPGKAIKIMTGAPTPEGADTVVMIEKTEASEKNNTVRIMESLPAGKNIAYRGEELKKDEQVLPAGTVLRPQEIGVLASVGQPQVKVYRRPTVAIVSTGDELVDINVKPQLAQIRNSNSYATAAQIDRMGLRVELLGIARDNIEDLTEKISRGLESDIFILTGGVSVGEFDLVEEVLKKLGVKLLFEKVAIKPGKPFVFGKKENHLVFALPGNPVSAFVITEIFIRPVVSALTGNQFLVRTPVSARISDPFPKITVRQQYVPAILDRSSNSVAVVKWHGSADLVSVTKANALLVVPPNVPPIKKGDSVDVIPLPR
ncbi:MAG: molybdopterin molybdotransferase MoeA [Planctomycetes bacterium]|nr:molybdopterin molybdotransferase MoeA [Planctomycetota bacterium]